MHKPINKESQMLPTAHRPLPTRARTPPTQYIELHARSAFSFLRGAATPEELIAACAELNMPAMALLDNDGVYGAARFHLAAQKVGIKAHIGAELTVRTDLPRGQERASSAAGASENSPRRKPGDQIRKNIRALEEGGRGINDNSL